jgi:TonB family protein
MKTLSAVSMSLAIVLALGPASRADEPVVAGENGVTAPKKTKNVLPEYPPEAQARGQRGIVIVELVINPEGKVSSAQVIRSIPPFDEAALAAVRQWEYEVTKVNGKPVSVKLTVPITFAMKIPEIASRQEGIPELRAGAFPPVPPDARDVATATAEITLGAEGNVEELRIVEGPPAYADSLARALRTWRFAPEASDATVTFQVHAQFNAAKGSGSKVEFRLDGLRRSESLATTDAGAGAPATPAGSAAPPAATPANAPGTAAPTAVAANPTATPPAPTPPTPRTVVASPTSHSPGGAGSAAPPSAPPPAPKPAAPMPTAPVAAAMPTVAPPAGPTPASYPAPAPGAVASGSPTLAAPGRPVATVPGPQPATPPKVAAVEVISVAPPPEPPENGLSAIRDVTLTPGVPDLTRGRRPVPPPFARMAQATGTVDVAFSVDAAGIASVKGSNGPDVFKRAAEQAVSSWTFRRTRADRIFLMAEFKYTTDAASVTVRPDVK